jgi:hypothetical protein
MRFVKKNDGQGETLDLLQVQYCLNHFNDDKLHEVDLMLYLLLDYVNSHLESISMAIVSANSKRS